MGHATPALFLRLRRPAEILYKDLVALGITPSLCPQGQLAVRRCLAHPCRPEVDAEGKRQRAPGVSDRVDPCRPQRALCNRLR